MTLEDRVSELERKLDLLLNPKKVTKPEKDSKKDSKKDRLEKLLDKKKIKNKVWKKKKEK